jgi:hypothetical protein
VEPAQPATSSASLDAILEIEERIMRMNAEDEKQNLLAELVDARSQILDLAESFEPSDQDTTFLGTWSIRDLLAHLIGWDITHIQAAGDLRLCQVPQFYGYHDRDWQSYNERLVREHKTDNFPELLKNVRASHQKLIEFMQAIPAPEFNLDRGVRFRGWKITLGRLLLVEARDEHMHAAQIHDFIDRKRREQP